MNAGQTAKRMVVMAGLAVLLAFGAATAQQPQTKKQEIYQLLSARHYAEAEKAAAAYLVSAPANCGVNVMLGLALRGQDKVAPAYKAFQAALQQCPQNLAAVEGAAETAFALNDAQAKGLVERVIQLRPQEETGYAMLGALDARAGDCAGAIENYAKAPNRIGQNAPALRQYGGCLLDVGKAAEAVGPLSQLLAMKDDLSVRLALAQAQFATKDNVGALATIQPALSAVPPSVAALIVAARIEEAQNDTPVAIAHLRKAMEIDPQSAQAYLAFSVISYSHGAFKVGVDFLTIGIHELPAEARLYVARGVLEVQLTQNDAALKDFQKAHQLEPKLSFADDAMGMLSSQNHDPAAALAQFAEQSRLHPNDALLQYIYAEALSESTGADEARLVKALALAKHAVALEPEYEPARDLLCVLLLRHNELEAVVEQANEAVRRDPYDELAIYQGVLAEHKLKHEEKSAAFVKLLREARAHNQQGRTKYLLEEAGSSASSPK